MKNHVNNLDTLTTNGYQSRLQEINFFNTLYYYEVVDTNALFDLLYTLIPIKSPKEKEDNSFRIRMACTLLLNLSLSGFKEVGKGGSKKAKQDLTTFLSHFNSFIYKGKHISLDLDYFVQDTFEALKPFKNSKVNQRLVNDHLAKLKTKYSNKEPLKVSIKEEKKQKEEGEEEIISTEETITELNEEEKEDLKEMEQFDRELQYMVDKSFTKDKQKRPLVKLDQTKMQNAFFILQNSKELKNRNIKTS